MYSVILMAAMTTQGPDAIAWGGRRGCAGNACYGCAGCWGGCNGGCYGGCWGCGGGGGGGWGCHGWRHSGWGCGGSYGCYGGSACYGGCYGCYGGCYGTYAMPAMPYHPGMNPMVAPPPDKKMETAPGGAAAPAKLLIETPAEAKLFVDDLPVQNTPRRQFSTPALEPGLTYYYTLRVEMSQDGRPVNETRRVIVRAGETVRETFSTPTAEAVTLK